MALGVQPHHLIGVDVGGTKIAGGIVDIQSGLVHWRMEIPTQPERGGAALIQSVTGVIASLEATAKLEGLIVGGTGLGICEIIDGAGQVRSTSLVDWRRIQVPAHLVSDVRAAALAEAAFGSARGLKHALYVSIGTGIASVLLIDGIPYAGASGAALVLSSAPRVAICDGCGVESRYVLEDIASGPALARAYSGASFDDARAVLSAAARGDAKAMQVIARATALLGNAIGQLANCLDPETIIVGGGLGSAPGFYWEMLREQIDLSLWRGLDTRANILQSALGADADLIGAALAAHTGVR